MIAVKLSSWPVLQNADFFAQGLNAFHTTSDAFGPSDRLSLYYICFFMLFVKVLATYIWSENKNCTVNAI